MKSVISTLEEVAEPLRGEYESRDGKFHLKIEGDFAPLVAANAKIVEFRDNNIALLKEVNELRPLKTKYEGLDADEARKAIEKIKGLGAKGIKDVEDFEARVSATVDGLLKPVKEQLAAEKALRESAEKQTSEMKFHSTVADAAKTAGAQAKALGFLSGLARDVFEIKDGNVVAKTGKFSREKPGEPLTVAEWLKDQAVENAFAFEVNKGGGATGDKPGTPAKVELKPGQTILKNPTPQQLGAAAKDIKEGKVKVQYDTDPVAQ